MKKMNAMSAEIEQSAQHLNGEIVLYQPDENTRLEVRVDDETVWLSTIQMSQLFNRDDSNIRRHINNIFSDGELQQENNVHFLHVIGVKKPVPFYNLDVIISVGYRVHSPQGIAFRQWATQIIKQYLLKGYAVNQQLLAFQRQIDTRFDEHSYRMMQIENTQAQQQQQLDFFIRTATPPAEMVFFNGEFFAARVAQENLIKTARTRAIIIDGYIDARTFDILGSRAQGVLGQIYTVGVGAGIKRLQDEHNRQPGVQPIEVFKWRNESHDRWLIIDDQLWHCGHSLNALGSKMSAITRLGKSPEDILKEIQ